MFRLALENKYPQLKSMPRVLRLRVLWISYSKKPDRFFPDQLWPGTNAGASTDIVDSAASSSKTRNGISDRTDVIRSGSLVPEELCASLRSGANVLVHESGDQLGPFRSSGVPSTVFLYLATRCRRGLVSSTRSSSTKKSVSSRGLKLKDTLGAAPLALPQMLGCDTAECNGRPGSVDTASQGLTESIGCSTRAGAPKSGRPSTLGGAHALCPGKAEE